MENNKYNFKLDTEHQNSLSLILETIKPNTTVLEFGPANGRLTQYMKEEMNCTIYFVEIDPIAAKDAAHYAEDYIVGDIERFEWVERFQHVKFDHIIFADVLEHLYQPKEVLKIAKTLLNKSGTISISIPNVAHNSIVIDLLQGKFNYNRTGLLDNTHIRFFTYTSLIDMFKEIQLTPVQKMATRARVGENEIDNHYEELPRAMAKQLKSLDYAEIYQYVFELKENINNENIETQNLIYPQLDYYFAQLYIEQDGHITEDGSIKVPVVNQNNISFDLSQYGNVNKLRFDPINTSCLFRLISIEAIMTTGEHQVIHPVISNADFINGTDYFFLSQDPSFIIELPESSRVSNVNVHYELIDYDFEPQLVDFFNKNKEMNSGHRVLNEHIAYLEERHNLLLKSLSWRLTKPLRAISNRLKPTTAAPYQIILHHPSINLQIEDARADGEKLVVNGWCFHDQSHEMHVESTLPHHLRRVERNDLVFRYRDEYEHLTSSVGFTLTIEQFKLREQVEVKFCFKGSNDYNVVMFNVPSLLNNQKEANKKRIRRLFNIKNFINMLKFMKKNGVIQTSKRTFQFITGKIHQPYDAFDG